MLTLVFFRFVKFCLVFAVILFAQSVFSNGNGGSLRPSLLDGVDTPPKTEASADGVNEVPLSTKDGSQAKSFFKSYIYGKGDAQLRPNATATPKEGANKPKASNASNRSKVRRRSRSSVDLNKFPKRYNHWLLDVVKPSHFGGHRCVLRSNTAQIEDGYMQTPVVLEVFSDLIKLSGKSPIDLSYSDLGIKVDAFDRVSIDAIVSDTDALFFVGLTSLVKQMASGNRMVVALGFWPIAPLDQVYSTEISLRGFSNGIKKLNECEKMLNKVIL